MTQLETGDYVAHISDDGKRFELVRDHLREVAEMAAEFARPFGASEWAYTAGLAHDIGKYSKEFQDRILRNGRKVDHSTAGALLLHDKLPLLSYCVAGHHAGLPDGGTPVSAEGGTLYARLKRARSGGIPDASHYRDEIDFVTPKPPILKDCTAKDKEAQAFTLSFLTRMVFSCLVDADFLCTERFMVGAQRQGLNSASLLDLLHMFEQKVAAFYPPKTELNRLRCGVLDDCLRAAEGACGVYSLTAPTGSGKTLALIGFGLKHACAHGMSRVVCVEPFTSIIDQNAQVYRDVFGGENVLEHQAGFDFDAPELVADSRGERLRLAAENWDAPIVVTTNVQLFESLYANKTSRCRKLHNIANSVIVLDEAQMIPTEYLVPCIKALAELVRNYGCTVLLCSATQPALNEFFEREGLKVNEIVSDVEALFENLRRVTYQSLGPIEDEELADLLASHGQALCIVNSRRQACDLYELVSARVSDENAVFHLTTLMYPEHRRAVLAHIRELVAAGRPCVVVATSLVEAGVDLDFPVVFRSVAGVDSMVQAAGRCNREGHRPREESTVYLFKPASGHRLPSEVSQRASISETVLHGLSVRDGNVSSTDSLDTVEKFFNNLYAVKDSEGLDKKGIVGSMSGWGSSVSIDFATAAQNFTLIEDGSLPVIIPDEEIADEIAQLELGIVTRAGMRRISRYAVNLYNHDIRALLEAGAIHAVLEGTYMLDDPSRYDNSTGLNTTVEGGEALFW